MLHLSKPMRIVVLCWLWLAVVVLILGAVHYLDVPTEKGPSPAYELRETIISVLGQDYKQGVYYIVEVRSGNLCFGPYWNRDGSLDVGKDLCFALNQARAKRSAK